MTMKRALLLLSALTVLPAQTARLPTGTSPTSEDNLPLAATPVRYQQWYNANDWLATARNPVRVRAIAFLAGNALAQGSTVDLEIRMAHLTPGLQPSATFNNNLTIDNTLVVPRTTITLAPAPAPNTRVATIAFVNEFVWNGRSGVIVDLKVFGNGNNNQSYLYPCRMVTAATGRTMRLFAPGNPASVTTATIVQDGQGLITEFDYVHGVTVSFGTGCLGGTGVPVAGTSGGLPVPPNPSWAQTLTNAAALAPTVLVIGGSSTVWAGIPLPIDLGIIGGGGCSLLVEPAIFFPASTSAAGSATVPIPIPGVTLTRRMIYTQWITLDPNALNGQLSATNGIWTIFG